MCCADRRLSRRSGCAAACVLLLVSVGCLAVGLEYRQYRWVLVTALCLGMALLALAICVLFRCDCCCNGGANERASSSFGALHAGDQPNTAALGAEQNPLMPSKAGLGPLYPVPPERALRQKYGNSRVDVLLQLRNVEIRKRCKELGATEEQLDDADDSDFAKEARMELLLRLQDSTG